MKRSFLFAGCCLWAASTLTQPSVTAQDFPRGHEVLAEVQHAPPAEPTPAEVLAGDAAPSPVYTPIYNSADCAPESCTPESCAPETVCEPGSSVHSPWDCLCSDEPMLGFLRKRKLGDSLIFSAGGQARHRYMDERNRLRPAPFGRATYQLHRHNAWFELGMKDLVNFHIEGIDASSFGSEINDAPIDVNRADLLQYYVDLNLFADDTQSLKLRYGRQFLKYGSQHLVSPLAWGNTFRNFEGLKVMYSNEDWDIDFFATRPVNGASGNIFRPVQFDHPDQSRMFSGVYATYKSLPVGTLDAYWLWLDEEEPRANFMDGDRHTIGLRYAGKHEFKNCDDVVGTWTWDLEGAYQFGTDNSLTEQGDVSAGFVSAITGYTFNSTPWTPNVSGVFWWGSGDSDPTDGEINTVSTLFPLGHAYWGQIDNLSGQNLIDYGILASVKPMKKLTLATHWHWFDKANGSDRINNIVGATIGPNNTDTHIGTELDLLATYQASKNLQFQAGYFMFFYGDAVTQTPLNRPDAHQFYFMTTLTY